MSEVFGLRFANGRIAVANPRVNPFTATESKRLHHDGDRQEGHPGRRVKVWCRPLVEKENVFRQMNQKPLRLWVIRRDRISHSR